MKRLILIAAAAACAPALAVNWDGAMLTGTTPGGKVFFEPNEEMAFTLRLEGVKETLPANTYFVDWERRGDDGLREKGRAPLPLPAEGLVLRTKCAKPGFVCLEANVVTADGKRVPKNHRWEKRVFFQGGAGVKPNEIPMAAEPADYDAFWAEALRELAAVPMEAELKPVACKDAAVKLYAVRIPCAGGRPVTGYLTIPVAASPANRMPITAAYRGASQDEQLPPAGGPHDRLSMLINPNGYELGRGPAYVKQFFKDVSQPGYGYGMGPKQNESRHTSYWKYCALRAIRYLQWIKTRPEWDGRELVITGGSQGDWQCYHAAAHVPGVTRIHANGSWGCDWTGQSTLGRLPSTYRPGCWHPDMAYFDPVFAAKRIKCPVNISFAGLGDYVSPPGSLTLVYRNLKGPKKITYVQGSTHGWRPAGMQQHTVDVGFDAATAPERTKRPAADPAAAAALFKSADLVYHLDAARADTLERDGSGRLAAWRSANGNGYVFRTETAAPEIAEKAFAEKSAVRFASAARTRLVGSRDVAQRTVVLVVRPHALRSTFAGVWGARGYDMGLRTAQGARAWENVRGGPDFNAGETLLVDGEARRGPVPFCLDDVQILALRHADDLELWGTKGKTVFTPALGGYVGGRGFDGDVAEVLAFGRVLSEAECRALTAALARKWRPEGLATSVDPLDGVRAALARGERRIVLPKRVYAVRPKDDGFYLRLRGLADVSIDFSGAELRGLVQTGFFHLEDCTNVTIRNVTLDYRDLPYTQARIVAREADGALTVETIDGYPRPPRGQAAGWPFQVYDGTTLELKNPMRHGKDFAVTYLADGRYRVTGGGNRAGSVGDIAVWSLPAPTGAREGDHVSLRDTVHSRATVRCAYENVTVYATPGGRGFEEHFAEGNVYRNCRLIRRAPEDDFAPRAVRRLRSGNHDAFMSRRAVEGPKLLGCTALYHCDDAVNICGRYSIVYEIRGNEVRLLEFTPAVFHPGDATEAMGQDGSARRPGRVTAFRRGGGLSDAEKAYLRTIGLWPGLADCCRTSSFVTLDDVGDLRRGDALVSARAQGNGFEIRGCHFGRNRAFGIRLRASHGRITDCVIDRPESCGIYLGPEYEWLEGGISRDVTIADNTFVGCRLHVSGTAAHRRRLPPDAYKGLVIRGNVETTEDVPVSRLDPLGYIRSELARGAKTVTLAKARHWLTLPPGRRNYLSLENLSGVTLDFGGAELVGTVKATLLALDRCTNVTVRNVRLDYADLPFTQALIEKVDADGGWDVRVIAGYPRPAQNAISEHEGVWPVQAYDGRTHELKNPMRFRGGLRIVRTGDDTYRITGGLDRRGGVGDIAVWSLPECDRATQRGAVNAACCAHCTFDRVRVHATPHGCAFAEYSADANAYRGCTIERCAPETDLFPRAVRRLRSGNHDAFNSRCSYRGPVLDGCTFQYHCDDCVNISGFYAFVTEAKGNVLRTAPNSGGNRIEPGDTCQIMTFDGVCLPDAKAVAVEPAGETTAAERAFFAKYGLWPGIADGVRRAWNVTLDRAVDLPRGSVIISNRRMGNGFVIRNCTLGHNRARGLLIKASDGLIENNLLEGVEGWGVQIAPECEWMEGGCSQRIAVRGNTLRGNGGGVLIAGSNGAHKPLPAGAHHDMAVTDNAISGGFSGIVVTGCTGLDLRRNAISLSPAGKGREVVLENVADVTR